MKIFKTLGKRGLALFLVLTMCLSLLSTTALAAETGSQDDPIQVVVQEGDIVYAAIAAATEFEKVYHYAAHNGQKSSNFAEYTANKYISLLNGKTTETQPGSWEWTPAGNNYTVYYKQSATKYYKYTYPAAGEGTYQVSGSEDGSNPVWVSVSIHYMVASSIVLKEDQTVSYELGSNLDQIKQAVFDTVVESTTPDLKCEDVTIQYYVPQSITHWAASWENLTADAAANGNSPQIRITWGGNSDYNGTTSNEVKVTFEAVDNRPELTLSANGVVSVDAACNAGDLKRQIADALSKTLSDGSTPVVNVDDLKMTYEATLNRMLDRVPDAENMLPTMKKWIDNPESAWYYGAVQEATNGHDYERDEMGVVETWTGLKTARDWKALEEAWAANSGSTTPAQPAEGKSGAENADSETENA